MWDQNRTVLEVDKIDCKLQLRDGERKKGDTCVLTSSISLFPSLALSLAFSLALALATGRRLVRGDLASLLQLTLLLGRSCQVAATGEGFSIKPDSSSSSFLFLSFLPFHSKQKKDEAHLEELLPAHLDLLLLDLGKQLKIEFSRGTMLSLRVSEFLGNRVFQPTRILDELPENLGPAI